MNGGTRVGPKVEHFALAKVLAANPAMLRVRPGASLFMAKYMSTFPARRHGDNLILHSHLPPLTGMAYSRFVSHHLVKRSPGPSHAQVGVTDALPAELRVLLQQGALRAADGHRAPSSGS